MQIEIKQEDWKDWLELKGLSERTIKDYSNYFDKIKLNQMSVEYLLKFLKKYNNVVARATIKNLKQYIRTGDFPQEIKGLFLELEIPRVTGRKKKRIPEVLTLDQVHMVANKMTSTRNYLATLTTFYLGLRLSELLSLKVNSFNWTEWSEDPTVPGIVKVIGKGNKQRNLPVIPVLMERLSEWIAEELRKNPLKVFLFEISKQYWQKTLSKVSQRVLGRRVNPHLLRHSCCTYLHKKGLDLKEIADFLGHASVSTTQLYTHTNTDQLNKKIANAFI